jgi:hypothetical protein
MRNFKFSIPCMVIYLLNKDQGVELYRNKHNELDTFTFTFIRSLEQPASTTAHNTHQNCVCIVTPEDGQVMPETCRGFEHE